MSRLFDGSNDTLTGTFASTYGDPLSIFFWFKFADHPAAIDCLVSLGNSNSSADQSYTCRTRSTDNAFEVVSQASGTDQANVTKTGIDGVWTPFLGIFGADNSRAIYVADLSASNSNTRAVADAIQFIRIGESFTAANDFAGYIAEVAVWKKIVDAGEITSLLAATDPSTIAPTDLIAFYPMRTDTGGTVPNLGTDADGDLTVSGSAAFNADHPPIVLGGAGKLRIMMAHNE